MNSRSILENTLDRAVDSEAFGLGGLVRFGLRQLSLFSPGCPGTYYVDQGGLKFMKIHLLVSPSAGIKGCTTLYFGFLFLKSKHDRNIT